MTRPSTVSIYISKLYDCEEVAETIAAELERQGLKVLRRDDRAMPRSTVVTFAKLDSLDPQDIAQTGLGIEAFTVVLSGDRSPSAFQWLKKLADDAVDIDESKEIDQAIEMFIADGGKQDSLDNREDAKKTLRKIGGKRPGKKCGNSYVSADKNCKGHSSKTESGKRKLTAAGKKSAEELAAKVRARKGMAAIGGKNQPEVKPEKTSDRPKRITKEEVNAAPWKYTAEQYQSAHGVHQPWIGEISPMQMGMMGKQQKAEYTKKRERDWEASSAIKKEWADKVWEAYSSGKITDADIASGKSSAAFGPMSAKSVVLSRKAANNKREYEAKLSEARKVNNITDIDSVSVGDRIFDLMTSDYRTVTKKNKASVVATSSEGKERKVPLGAINWRSYNDLVDSVKNGEPVKPESQQPQKGRKDSLSTATIAKALSAREDAKKTLRKIGGKRPGKKCKGSYISADKKCSSDYGLTPSGKRKLTDMGKKSAVELANKVRQQRGLTAVTREGSGQPLPFDRKSRQSASIAKATMSVKDRREKLRREFDPNSSGKRAEMIAKKEERRAIVGLGGTQKAMAEADAVAPEKPKKTPDKPKEYRSSVKPSTILGKAAFYAYRRSEELAKVPDNKLVEEWQNSSLMRHILDFDRERWTTESTRNQHITANQFGGPDYRKKLWEEIERRGISSEADNYVINNKESSTPKLTAIQGGKASQDKALAKMSAGELFKEADRVGSKYQSPNDPIDLTARRQAAEILKETGVTKAIDRATGKGRLTAIEGGGQSTPKSPLGNLGAKLLTTMNETNQQMAKLVEQKAAIEKKYAKTPKPKTTQVAQLQALREAKIKNGTFKRSTDSVDRSFG